MHGPLVLKGKALGAGQPCLWHSPSSGRAGHAHSLGRCSNGSAPACCCCPSLLLPQPSEPPPPPQELERGLTAARAQAADADALRMQLSACQSDLQAKENSIANLSGRLAELVTALAVRTQVRRAGVGRGAVARGDDRHAPAAATTSQRACAFCARDQTTTFQSADSRQQRSGHSIKDTAPKDTASPKPLLPLAAGLGRPGGRSGGAPRHVERVPERHHRQGRHHQQPQRAAGGAGHLNCGADGGGGGA